MASHLGKEIRSGPRKGQRDKPAVATWDGGKDVVLRFRVDKLDRRGAVVVSLDSIEEAQSFYQQYPLTPGNVTLNSIYGSGYSQHSFRRTYALSALPMFIRAHGRAS